MPTDRDVPDVLAKICARTRLTVAEARARVPEPDVASAAPARPLVLDGFGVIAEVKRASPSAGAIASDADAVGQASTYAASGAAAISVLTDGPHFGGSLEDLCAVRAALPQATLLRKDFTVDPYQIAEARAAGADLVLLIVAALLPDEVTGWAQVIRDFGMTPLVETHDVDEIPIALEAVADGGVLGVNARDLRTLAVDLAQWDKAAEHIPSGVCSIAESGIRTVADGARAKAAGYDGVLCGEALMRSGDPAAFVRALREA